MTEAGAIAETAIGGQDQDFVATSGRIQFRPQLLTHLDEAAREVLQFYRFFVLFPLLRAGVAAWTLDTRDLLEANRHSTGAHVGAAMQWRQQRGLKKAQAQHQVDVKGRR